MTRSEFEDFLDTCSRKLIGGKLDIVHELFLPFMQDKTLDRYECEYNAPMHDLKLVFYFKNSEPIIKNYTRAN